MVGEMRKIVKSLTWSNIIYKSLDLKIRKPNSLMQLLNLKPKTKLKLQLKQNLTNHLKLSITSKNTKQLKLLQKRKSLNQISYIQNLVSKENQSLKKKLLPKISKKTFHWLSKIFIPIIKKFRKKSKKSEKK